MRRVAARRVADTSEIRQGMRHGAARRVAAKVSCFKMDRVVSLALLCEEVENEEYELRNKRKRFWVHVALLKIVLSLSFGNIRILAIVSESHASCEFYSLRTILFAPHRNASQPAAPHRFICFKGSVSFVQ